MEIIFEKYQGAGNDFVLIDQRKQQYIVHNDERSIAHLCDRRFGIGADGLILLEASEKTILKWSILMPMVGKAQCVAMVVDALFSLHINCTFLKKVRSLML